MRIVILGNGIAGNAVAFAVRKYDRQCRITIISGEECPGYDPGALPYYLSGDVARKVVFLKGTEDYRDNGIDLVLGSKASRIAPGEKKVYLENGSEFEYDRLVIAVGGDQIIPPIPGVDKKGVFCCKVLADAEGLARHDGKRAVVIGSGLIGIEASEALKKLGYQVHLVELLGWIMPKVFDEEPARILTESLVTHGIDVFVDEKVVRINGEERVSGVTTDKRELACDTVVLATGVVPATGLAASAGIEIGKTRGIKVNEKMMTSVEDIYACGDCVETKDVFTGEEALYLLRHNALEQAEVVARNCVGIGATYAGAWNFTRAHYFGTHAVSIGRTLSGMDDPTTAEVIEQRRGSDYYRLVIYKGRLAGAQAIGRPANQAGILLGAMWRGDDFDEIRSKWGQVSRINSPYPWNYRVLGRYMGLWY